MDVIAKTKCEMIPKNGVTEKWFIKSKYFNPKAIFDKWGVLGVTALAEATPTDTGQTANSWHYEVVNRNGDWSVSFINDNVKDGIPIVILLQYGHLTRNGGYYQGIDFINPAIKPIFDGLQTDLNKELSKL